jgi:hypothetical protein
MADWKSSPVVGIAYETILSEEINLWLGIRDTADILPPMGITSSLMRRKRKKMPVMMANGCCVPTLTYQLRKWQSNTNNCGW